MAKNKNATKTWTRESAMAAFKNDEISEQEFEKILDKLEQAKRSQLYCKVSAKGAVSVYGLQRMPVTLYAQQWQRLLEFASGIHEFIDANESDLSFKVAKDAEE